MLVLFETPAGFALFKVLDEGKVKNVSALQKAFASPASSQKMVKLKAFNKFANTQEAMQAVSALVESKLSKPLQSFLKKQILKDKKDELAVSDKVLGGIIKEKMGIPCVHDKSTLELIRGIRSQMSALLGDVANEKEFSNMALGLAHSLSRYKLKFSPDKVDTMIVQAIALLDDLDKELNIYVMRVKEWYGWHFPELAKIIPDNVLYAKVALKLQDRNNARNTDLTDLLPEELAEEVKDISVVSMGTEISEGDLLHVCKLCEQVISISEYRTQLFEYLKNRMQAIAPNLTHMVGELIGARLISHAGNLLNLAKYPASTVQILGAEKALFRALKARHNTPKYGLIYHASLIGKAPTKHKGKIARVLAAKCAISARVDALGDSEQATIAVESLDKVEDRLRTLEGSATRSLGGKSKGKQVKEQGHRSAKNPAILKGKSTGYDASGDFTATTNGKEEEEDDVDMEDVTEKKVKKEKKSKKEKKEKKEKKKEKKRKREEEPEEEEEEAEVEVEMKEESSEVEPKKKKSKKEKKEKKEKKKEKKKRKSSSGAE